eukprot:CAMPEP_0113308242 /NCGR_PEP_ID=MMETSP0010_2-20120614/6756_1 /TAXON_ID=216773 ORGANISM="Corethron hystrix, Strain 308" /NCGR_SAMPLE_ID=MMETSP0010_2 /ASSEMBLY_ACC=CAM_ASM_000155 /LENGTH=63 /DNA_ID=CAMNT_0000163239 /DNA_START=1824 /DNA_END=2012 /DNA_ORIENTATION=- /assembly_acc=CAM_ASM_000155
MKKWKALDFEQEDLPGCFLDTDPEDVDETSVEEEEESSNMMPPPVHIDITPDKLMGFNVVTLK